MTRFIYISKPSLLFVVTLAISVTSCSRYKVSEKDSPFLSIDQPSVDLGKIIQYESKSHIFRLHNNSNKPITILSVRPSCTCTSFKISNTVVEPSKDITIQASVNALDRIGSFYTKLLITWKTSDSINQQESWLELKGAAKNLAIIDRPTIDFGRVASSKTTIPLHLQLDELSAHWNSLEVSAKKLKLSTVKLQNEYVINIELDPNQEALGAFQDLITLRFTGGELSEEKKVTIPVFAHIAGIVEANPPTIYLGTLNSSESHFGRFLVKTTSREDLSILEIEKSPHFTFNYKKLDSTTVDFMYYFNSESLNGDQSRKIIIKALVGHKVISLGVPFIAYIKTD